MSDSQTVYRDDRRAAEAAHDRITELEREISETMSAARVLRRQHEAVVKVLKGYATCRHGCVTCPCTKAATDALDLLGEDYDERSV